MRVLQLFTQSVGLLRRGIRPSQGLYLRIGQHKHKINADNRDIHALSGIRTTIPAFERAKAVHALDGTATVIGSLSVWNANICYCDHQPMILANAMYHLCQIQLRSLLQFISESPV
jgi:hypothetical protein